MTHRTRTFWVGDVPARDQGLPECGAEPSEWYPTGCTREADHPGDHGHPNWTGRTEAVCGPVHLDLETRNTHGGAPMVLRSRAAVAAYLQWVESCAQEVFGDGDE